MKYPWRVEAEELFALRGAGGQRFTELVNALLRTDLASSSSSPADAQTNIRVNLGDGGVDTEISVAMHGHLAIDEPTAWQFKATSFAEITPATLRKEANKHEAQRLIRAGHQYIVCVCDDSPSAEVRGREETLLSVVREINPDAPTPRILVAGHLADWASRFPGIVIEFFRPYLDGLVSVDAWLRRERADLPRFVDIPSRAEAARVVVEHAGATSAQRPVLSLTAPSGSGATRLLAESLAPFAAQVLYTSAAGAGVRLATTLANHAEARAIVVVDRCSLRERMQIEETLKAEGQHVRAIVIQDPTEQTSAGTVALKPLESAEVQTVVDANFADVPASHRRAFVHLADGMLKIAGRLAVAYQANKEGFLVDAAAWASDELRRLVPDQEDIRALRALSLFSRVGYRGQVEGQLRGVCDQFTLDAADVLDRCRRLAEQPGVVAIGPRYVSEAEGTAPGSRGGRAAPWRAVWATGPHAKVSGLQPTVRTPGSTPPDRASKSDPSSAAVRRSG